MKVSPLHIAGWHRVIRLGEIDCSNSKNRGSCQAFGITAFPTIRFFQANSHDPAKSTSKRYIGKRSTESLVQSIVDYVESLSLVDNLAAINESKSVVQSKRLLGLVFENEGSYVGRQLILDFQAEKDVEVKRVLSNNKFLVKHYSILEFPTLVLQKQDEGFSMIPGDNVKGDVAIYYKEKIDEHLSKWMKKSAMLNKQAGDKLSASHALEKKYVAVIRPTATDLSSAISYALRMEVSLHTIVSGSAFTALFKFVQVLEQTLHISSHPKLHSGLGVLRRKLDSRLFAGFVVVSDLLRVMESKLDQTVFPLHPVWESCSGSKAAYRGFPCGLWSLMHTVTILSLTNGTSSQISSGISHFNTREVLNALIEFVRNFFSCEPCRHHFSQMADTLQSHPLSYNGDAVLWLWEVHNVVNQRLQDDISTDPKHPKIPFPPHNLCPYCYVNTEKNSRDFDERAQYVGFDDVKFTPGESLVQAQMNLSNQGTPSFFWNRTAVFLFLYNFYTPADHPHQSLTTILQAAWPRNYLLSLANHKPNLESKLAGIYLKHPRANYDISIIKGVLVLALVTATVLLVLRKRRCHKMRSLIHRTVSPMQSYA